MENILIGMAVGDAVGVPYEFKPQYEMAEDPATDMRGYGTHNQPKGTWSDDTSMALCIVESLTEKKELDYEDIADKFTKWIFDGYWTARGDVFDFGNATVNALEERRDYGTDTLKCGGKSIDSNGNGSVMRTLALVPYLKTKNIKEKFRAVNNVSSITHAHSISTMSCNLVCIYAGLLKQGFDPKDSWIFAAVTFSEYFSEEKEYREYFKPFIDCPVEDDYDGAHCGSGFARDTAFTSIWCLRSTNSYKEAVLKAVNYGDDTDTTACVTGGLAGLYYGIEGIPEEWIKNLARKDDIIDLAKRYELAFSL